MGVATALLIAAEEPAAEVVKKTNNPILPVSNELFWGALCFVLLWALMKWVLLPPIVRAMQKRDDVIRDDLAAAEAAREQAEAKVSEYEESLAGAKAEAVRVMEDARSQAEEQRRQIMADAEADAAAVRAKAAEEVAEAKEAARAQLRDSVADIAVAAAGAVVRKPLDRNAEMQVIEDYVNRTGSPN